MEAATAGKTIDTPLGHTEAMWLAETEFVRMIEQLGSLSAEEWREPTVCESWDVRAMASHVLGMAEAQDIHAPVRPRLPSGRQEIRGEDDRCHDRDAGRRPARP